MNTKQMIWFGLVVGSTVGSFIPTLWGAGMLSFSSILLSAVGGIGGIWLAFKVTH